ncbi:hypothetical protein ACWDXD_24680 [Streptomyces sp. NPDC003314]
MTTAVAPPLTRTAIVFDLEGCLIDVSSIHHLANNAAAFHRAALGCPLNRGGAEAARQAHHDGKTVLVMTGADRRLEDLVSVWLGRNAVPASRLLMRNRQDYRPAAVVKRDRLRLARGLFDQVTVWSADPSVTRVLAREGFAVKELPGYWGDTQ